MTHLVLLPMFEPQWKISVSFTHSGIKGDGNVPPRASTSPCSSIMTYSIRFPCPRIAHAPLPLQLAEAGAQHYDGYGNPPVVSGFVLPLQAHPRGQPTFQSTAVTDAGVLPCCEYSCGRPVPLIVNGNYNDPIGDGKTHIAFNVTNSPWCGISVAKVLRGDLEGLMQRDELAILNPRSKSMRLKIDVSIPPSSGLSQRLICVKSGPATMSLRPRLARVQLTTCIASHGSPR